MPAQIRPLSVCPVDNCLQLIASKWKTLILWKLSQHTSLRFSDLRRAIPTITKKMLTQQLRQLEADQLISRTVSSNLPVRVEYALTDFGKSLMPIFQEMMRWSEAHQQRIQTILTRSDISSA